MIRGGLTSVTFRQLSPLEVIKLVERSPLTYIEWGGDVHVPHGDIKLAEQIYQMTVDGGLKISSYGSYYFVGESEPTGLSFQKVLDTAIALKAPVIRIWAGRKGSMETDEFYRNMVIEDSLLIADMAASEGIQLAYEYHAGTLTDTID